MFFFQTVFFFWKVYSGLTNSLSNSYFFFLPKKFFFLTYSDFDFKSTKLNHCAKKIYGTFDPPEEQHFSTLFQSLRLAKTKIKVTFKIILEGVLYLLQTVKCTWKDLWNISRFISKMLFLVRFSSFSRFWALLTERVNLQFCFFFQFASPRGLS